ncbi:iron complex outermembrane recepter protein [Pseudarcicella hirudinis]|uniref:Iron complex outermembrane recepter protein n=1 Tax=Pseudarcicella hirudinis TaxID=1079859 RepID=A0A1I5TP78_9BACT|nr:iron complex outermembrane recepter protein [Pseudarcicella hirudinis]
MKKSSFYLILLLLSSITVWGQNTSLQIKLEDAQTHEPLIGATVRVKGKGSIGASADASGIALFKSLPSGKLSFEASFVGYESQSFELELPLPDSKQPFLVSMAASHEALEEITVSASRTNSRIEDLPIKVEVLGQEDMDEESSVVPGNVASILGDISIIHIQKTSPTNGNQAIRMQGLDSKYTQILRDGIPLFEGFSGNLGVLQIPPLDLKQVEVVKGSVSTLYGGGAIGGMINIVSKTPTSTTPEFTGVLNRSNLKETNLNAYYAQKYGKTGLTLFAGWTNQQAVDVNSDGFSDSPLIKQFSFHPRFFYDISENNHVNVGYSFITEKRAGGWVNDVNNEVVSGPNFVSATDFQRHTVDYNFKHGFRKGHDLTVKGAVSYFDRNFTEGSKFFKGNQTSSYTEISDYLEIGNHKLVFGGNYTLEDFRKPNTDSTLLNSYNYNTLGFFAQDDWQFTPKVSLQTGLRVDHHNVFGTFVLPRISLMTKPSQQWTIRWSVGTGYKNPNVFANQTPANKETSVSYWNLLPLSADIKPEHSVGSNIDVAYSVTIAEKLNIQIDQAFYYTNITDPVIAQATPGASVPRTYLSNAAYDIRSYGTDTYLRMTYEEYEFYLGYNHTIAKRAGTGETAYLPFSPQDKFSLTLAYTIEGKWRFGVESSFVGNQYLYDNQKVNNYSFWAVAVERKFGEHLSLVLNAENVLNVKQSDYEKVVSGTNANPVFNPIWAPQEGAIVNLALKFKL